MIQILPAHFPEDVETLRVLFLEYENFLGFSLCFQGFAEEVKTLPGKYALPLGGCWIAWEENEPVGCVALRPLQNSIGEVKRLYIRSAGRGQGVGRKLMERVIAEARIRNYHALYLDTLSRLETALQLYHSLGFKTIDRYNDNTQEGVCFLGLSL